MISYKRNFIILFFSIIIYFILNFCYKFFFLDSNNKQTIYILKEDVAKGQELTLEKVENLKVYNTEFLSNISNIDINNSLGKVTNYKLYKGQILDEKMFVKKDEYVKSSNEKEIVSIKISNSDDIASFQIGKENIINVYYTGKTAQLQNILNLTDLKSISSSSQMEGYTTIKFLNEIQIIDVFDKFGNSLDIKKDTKNNLKNDSQIIDTIMMEVDEKSAININNLKNYGEFSISIIK